MYRICKKEILAPNIIHMRFEAPRIAGAARPGQFLILRVDERGERLPLSLAGWDTERGTVDVVFYVLGTSTMKLASLKEGDCVLNLAGPLGEPTEISHFGEVICACGCFGIGPTIPLIKALKDAGNHVVTVVEGRGRSFIFWEDRLRDLSDELHIVLGDGSCSEPGWANEFISRYLAEGKRADRIFVHGCPFMMMVVSEASRPFEVRTVVSLTPLMVDGTGMCGACRVEVGGETRFACVDGPDFDGHLVNWRTLTNRMRQLVDEEDLSQRLWERRNWHRLVQIQTNGNMNGRCYR
ncbi:sulfide/dihydroorotate dehydrogenase-like FAD/NAD-binding protein [Methanothrix sp.]|uniref:sulfide/dihydroorotate dehydrogenase-like FAD/NAD-binding protein n=1 Tax=Methanothrix sp. TaxID=90426 RepID=UPI003C733D80